MNDAVQIITGLLILILVFIGTRFAVGWRIKKSAFAVLDDLERQGALSVEKAVELPYAKANFFRFGLRDYRPKAIEALAVQNIIGRTEDGRFYVADPEALERARQLRNKA